MKASGLIEPSGQFSSCKMSVLPKERNKSLRTKTTNEVVGVNDHRLSDLSYKPMFLIIKSISLISSPVPQAVLCVCVCV